MIRSDKQDLVTDLISQAQRRGQMDRVEAAERPALNQVASENQERINQFDPNVGRPISIEGPRCSAMGGGRKATFSKLPRQSGLAGC